MIRLLVRLTVTMTLVISGIDSIGQHNLPVNSHQESVVKTQPNPENVPRVHPYCEQNYYATLYEITVEYFSAGMVNITVEGYERVVFEHVRTSGRFSPDDAEVWIRHIRAIPWQLVEIIREDPAVLENCYNFAVALTGPP